MKKRIIIFFSIILLTIIASAFFFAYKDNKSLDIFKTTDEQINLLLKTNSDALEYIEKNNDYFIVEKKVLSIEDIEAGLSGKNFKEVYEGLLSQSDRYIRVQLMNQAEDMGLVSIIDFKDRQTIKAYGILLFKPNEQESSQSENK